MQDAFPDQKQLLGQVGREAARELEESDSKLTVRQAMKNAAIYRRPVSPLLHTLPLSRQGVAVGVERGCRPS